MKEQSHSTGLPLGDLPGGTFVNIKGLAEHVGVDPKTVRLWIDNGQLPAPVGVGKSKGWTVEFLRDFLYQRLIDAQDPDSRDNIIKLNRARRNSYGRSEG